LIFDLALAAFLFKTPLLFGVLGGNVASFFTSDVDVSVSVLIEVLLLLLSQLKLSDPLEEYANTEKSILILLDVIALCLEGVPLPEGSQVFRPDRVFGMTDLETKFLF